jgi:hypothetical protein
MSPTYRGVTWWGLIVWQSPRGSKMNIVNDEKIYFLCSAVFKLLRQEIKEIIVIFLSA